MTSIEAKSFHTTSTLKYLELLQAFIRFLARHLLGSQRLFSFRHMTLEATKGFNQWLTIADRRKVQIGRELLRSGSNRRRLLISQAQCVQVRRSLTGLRNELLAFCDCRLELLQSELELREPGHSCLELVARLTRQ